MVLPNRLQHGGRTFSFLGKGWYWRVVSMDHCGMVGSLRVELLLGPHFVMLPWQHVLKNHLPIVLHQTVRYCRHHMEDYQQKQLWIFNLLQRQQEQLHLPLKYQKFQNLHFPKMEIFLEDNLLHPLHPNVQKIQMKHRVF